MAAEYVAYAARHALGFAVTDQLLQADGVHVRVALVDASGDRTPVPILLKNVGSAEIRARR